MKSRNFYAVLGVSADAATGKIKTAFRKRARECHPDKVPDTQIANEMMADLNRIMRVLSFPDERAAYDRWLKWQEKSKLKIVPIEYQISIYRVIDPVDARRRGWIVHEC